MKATTALLELFKEEWEWRQFFRSCSEMSTHRLSTQTFQFREELKDRGHPYPAEDVEYALLDLTCDLLPESAAAKWDTEWAHELCKDTLARLAEYHARLTAEEKDALDLSAQDAWDERVDAAGLDNNPAVFRRALKGWERSGMEAIERVRMHEAKRSVKYGSHEPVRTERAHHL